MVVGWRSDVDTHLLIGLHVDDSRRDSGHGRNRLGEIDEVTLGHHRHARLLLHHWLLARHGSLSSH